MLHLAAFFLALGFANCDGSGDGEVELLESHRQDQFTDVSYPCGPFMEHDWKFHQHFLKWTPDGSQLIFDYRTAILVVDAAGTQLRQIADVNPGDWPPYGFHADVSPDGTRVVYATCQFPTERDVRFTPDPERAKLQYEIATINLDGTGLERLTQNTYLDHYPVLSPDGDRVVFVALPRSSFGYGDEILAELFVTAVDGSGTRRVASILGGRNQEDGSDKSGQKWLGGVAFAPPAWSPDGEYLVFLVNVVDHVSEEGYWQVPIRKALYSVRPNGSELTRIAEDVVGVASWSPDGQRLAVAKYAGDEVVLISLAADGSDPKRITRITAREGFENQNGRYNSSIHTVSWAPDGMQILFSCDFGACVVGVEDGRVTGLVEEAAKWGGEPYIAAWSPDGSRIAIYTPGDGRRVTPQIFTVTSDGTDRRDLIRLDDDGNLVPANLPREGS